MDSIENMVQGAILLAGMVLTSLVGLVAMARSIVHTINRNMGATNKKLLGKVLGEVHRGLADSNDQDDEPEPDEARSGAIKVIVREAVDASTAPIRDQLSVVVANQYRIEQQLANELGNARRRAHDHSDRIGVLEERDAASTITNGAVPRDKPQ